MSRITNCFSDLKSKNKTALIPFITAGDPNPDITVPLLHKLVESGADIIEIGIPFSDPMADGPVIQKASERALKHGTSLSNVLDMVSKFREENSNTPLILMGYLNPIEIMGYKEFTERAKKSGVDGVLIVDLPPEEADELKIELEKQQLDEVFLLSPTTTDVRIEKICAAASGFLYYVSLKGVTGSNQLDVKDVKQKIENIKTKTELPVGVGFGIKDPDSARQVAGFCDAVIVGSSLVEKIAAESDTVMMLNKAGIFISELSDAVNNRQ